MTSKEEPSTVPPRDRATRKDHALRMLGQTAIDGWVATTSASAQPHLVPLSLTWVGQRVVIAVPVSSKTARNIDDGTTVRIGAGATRDVVMIDAVMESQLRAELDSALRSSFTTQAGWDPGRESGYVFLVLRPTRVQAWRERNEMPDRDLMVDGCWLV
jgi:hypothetical protein